MKKYFVVLTMVLIVLVISENVKSDVILSPVSVTASLPTESNYPNCIPDRMIDHSGLVTSFLSGVTDYSIYMSQSPKNESAFKDNCYNSENDYFGSGVSMDFDLGENYYVNNVVIWNGNVNGSNETSGIKDTTIYLSEYSDFSDSTSYNVVVDQVADASVPHEAFVFNLGDSILARYVRFDVSTNHGNPGHYSVSEVAFGVSAEPVTLLVPLDIKPQSCPNPLAARSKGVLPVAILGTEDFDVTTIDIATITLAGVSPLRSNLEDVATPLNKDDECECSSEGPDGFTDLTLKFDRQEIIAALGDLSLLPRRSVIPLTLSGMLMGDDMITLEGTDCIVLLNLRQGK
jgi:hypothetical protein